MAYSPETQAYIDRINAYADEMSGKGYTVNKHAVAGPEGEDPYANLIRTGVDPKSLVDVGHTFLTNKGNRADYKSQSGVLWANPDAQYHITNEHGKDKLLYSGSGIEGLDQVYAIAQELSKSGGKKANWGVEMYDPASGQWVRSAEDNPSKNLLGKIADFALPLAGALLMPVTGGLSGALAAGLGAAGGSALSGVAQGKSIGNILKGAALSGGLSYLGGSALGGLGGGSGGAASGAGAGAAGGVGSAAGSALGALPGDIVVQGLKGGLGSAVGGALGGAAGGAAAGALGGSGALPNDIVVQGARGLGQSLPNALGSISGAALTGAANQLGGSAANNEIVVEGQKPLVPENFTLTPEMLASLGITTEFAATPQGKSTVDKIISGLKAAGLLTGLVGNAIGGGGKSGTGTVPGALGNLNPIFSKTLPTTNIPGGVGTAANFAPRQMPEQDWNRYAMHPEQSFFNYVPQRYTPPVQAFAKGGMAVKGKGTGRSDEIDAKLSDGEYVVDAETVSLLGDGSSNAGAKALDNLRVAVRKHKGRSLAKGKFSAKAKQPERYLGVRK